jgi:hypothetical protein
LVGRLSDITDLDGLMGNWTQIYTNVYIPFDNERQIHVQQDGYFDLDPANQTINQADVGLLQYPLMMPMEKTIAENDLVFWINKTKPDGYFTGNSAYVIAWLGLNNVAEGQKEFEKSYGHFQMPFFIFNEKRFTNKTYNFITGAGGFMQSLLYGWGGIRISKQNVLEFNPHFPASELPNGENMNSIEISSISFLGNELDVKVERNAQVTVSIVARPGSVDNPLCVAAGTETQLRLSAVGDSVKLDIQPFELRVEADCQLLIEEDRRRNLTLALIIGLSIAGGSLLIFAVYSCYKRAKNRDSRLAQANNTSSYATLEPDNTPY